ncbi:gluconokinase [Vogesella oryzae]|uniref:gluconokinase n=1 Tax=Vogesella oryzae TaxID=1735285 RepID=UPI001C2EF2E6|nr:gluconokinase [Vogesella oryzae]
MNKITTIVLMGVCGSGKSVIGEKLAQMLGFSFVEGDNFHPAANIQRMEAGTPLTDQDRKQWLETLRDQIARAREQQQPMVLSCSALKRKYRQLLQSGDPTLLFIHLHGKRELIETRMQARADHFMPTTLLDSQLADLEPPAADEPAITIDIDQPVEQLLQSLLQQLAQTRSCHD